MIYPVILAVAFSSSAAGPNYTIQTFAGGRTVTDAGDVGDGAPAGGQSLIGVLGILVAMAHTFTTLPALAK